MLWLFYITALRNHIIRPVKYFELKKLSIIIIKKDYCSQSALIQLNLYFLYFFGESRHSDIKWDSLSPTRRFLSNNRTITNLNNHFYKETIRYGPKFVFGKQCPTDKIVTEWVLFFDLWLRYLLVVYPNHTPVR